ncbi:MAG: bifunctional DNA-formamidopyrimidine glycosylase/DNA-(apurinic or apyrimidinic site) lyase [Candidatus Nanoperiomorbaceae bacterium]
MPELPEVETIRRGLSSRILRRKVRDVTILNNKSLQSATSDLVFVKNHRVTAARRRAKVLILDLDDNYSLLFHLKMTGQLVFRDDSLTPHDIERGTEDMHNFGGGHPTESLTSALPDKSTRLIFTFDDDSKLFFNDQRKFGWCKIIPTAQITELPFIAKLGPEIVDFTAHEIATRPSVDAIREFIQRARHHQNAPIKAVILDQAVVAGIVNIYADEALWGAKIHPMTRLHKLSDADLSQILVAARDAMTKSISAGGSTMKNYVRSDGSRGDYLDLFANVFRRDGQPCLRCGATIIKTRAAGRGTYICPVCQVKDTA